jgi:GT2 family glycosyltransferase
VPSHDRPLRLRWLLNALEEQTLARELFEVIVVHDSATVETDDLLASHPIGAAAIRVEPCGPARKRNAGWRVAAAPTIVFTDDDCRPPSDWLERLLNATRRSPGAIVQGRVAPDPGELAILEHAPWARSQEVEPPSPYGQTANMAYPREVIERAGGFDESLPVAAGEDTDLLLRARAGGAPYVGAPEAITYHAVFDLTFPERVREAFRWQHLATIVKRYPHMRRHLVLGVFWKAGHPLLLLAIAGFALRRPWLAAPYVLHCLGAYGPSARGRARALSEIPARSVLDAAEIVAAARGSVRARTVWL